MCRVESGECMVKTPTFSESEVEVEGEAARLPSTSSLIPSGRAARNSGSTSMALAGDLKTGYGDVDRNLLFCSFCF